MEKYGIGQPVLRREDQRFLTGAGNYLDDIEVASCTHAVFVRSPHAHADISAIDTAPALAMPGVLAVLTVDDLLAADIKLMPTRTAAKNSNGEPLPAWMALAHQRARFCGEAVAMVVAESIGQARFLTMPVLVVFFDSGMRPRLSSLHPARPVEIVSRTLYAAIEPPTPGYHGRRSKTKLS